jgi:hypothetical protein
VAIAILSTKRHDRQSLTAARRDDDPLRPHFFEARHHTIDEAAITRIKPGVMVINTSRGALIDRRAIIEGLKSGVIGALGLDVARGRPDDHERSGGSPSSVVIRRSARNRSRDRRRHCQQRPCEFSNRLCALFWPACLHPGRENSTASTAIAANSNPR